MAGRAHHRWRRLAAAWLTNRTIKKVAAQQAANQAAADTTRAQQETARFKAQLEAERNRLREQHRADLERQKLQHAEDHLRNREGTYVLLLDVLERAMVAIPDYYRRTESGHPEIAEVANKRAQQLLDEAGHLINAVRLFAPQPVADLAEELSDLTWSMYREAREARERGEEVREPPRAGDFNAKRRELVAAMRADVAPDRP